jgi:hypothetical protein
VRRFDEAITMFQAAAVFRETGDEHNKRIALVSLGAARTARQAPLAAGQTNPRPVSHDERLWSLGP